MTEPREPTAVDEELLVLIRSLQALVNALRFQFERLAAKQTPARRKP